MHYALLTLLVDLPGITGAIGFGYFALIDWNALQEAYEQFSNAVQSASNLETLFAAEA